MIVLAVSLNAKKKSLQLLCALIGAGVTHEASKHTHSHTHTHMTAYR